MSRTVLAGKKLGFPRPVALMYLASQGPSSTFCSPYRDGQGLGRGQRRDNDVRGTYLSGS